MSVPCAAPASPITGGLFGPLIIDNFAGLGGASYGIKLGTRGRSVDVCVNHCPRALEFHARNHPETRHIRSDVWDVDPFEACGWDTVVHIRPGRRRPSHRRLRELLKRAGKAVGLAWFSPDCRHFSPARGSAPVSPRVRSLAWIVVKYARTVRPEVMMVENVRAFVDWGPVRQRVRDGKSLVDKAGRPVMEPIPERKGETFRRWVRNLEREGYVVEWKVLDAADYGVPQHRRRLFVVARRDGKPIKWPEKTHGTTVDQGGEFGDRGGRRDRGRGRGGRRRVDHGLLPYRTAAECIDWSIEPTSIFDRPRPLAENTQRRLFDGFIRYVVEDADPFILRIGQQGGRGSYVGPTDAPLGTIVTKAEHCLVVPNLVEVNHGGEGFRGGRVDDPMRTVTGAHGQAMGGAYLAQVGYGERSGQRPRSMSIEAPLGTVVAGGGKHALVVPWLTQHFGGMVGKRLGPSTMTRLGTTGVFLDPPYVHSIDRAQWWLRHLQGDGPSPGEAGVASNRTKHIYANDRVQDVDRLVAEVTMWCLRWGSDPAVRIAVCGLEGEYPQLESAGWDVHAWKSNGGYGNRKGSAENENSRRERVWFSPHCLKPASEDGGLFA